MNGRKSKPGTVHIQVWDYPRPLYERLSQIADKETDGDVGELVRRILTERVERNAR